MTPKHDVEVGGSQASVRITAIVDTGFEGEVCIPVDLAVDLGLELAGKGFVELADGTQKKELLFQGWAEFLADARPVLISLTDSEDSLIGTRLLSDCRLTVDFPTSKVSIRRKPPRRRGGLA